ncbi:MAG: hypothetical protein ACRCY8_05995 [Dermatophilaceae bacterium]
MPSLSGRLVAVLGYPPQTVTRGGGRLDPDGRFVLTVPDNLQPDVDGMVSPDAQCATIDFTPPDLLVAILPVLLVRGEDEQPVGQLIQATGVEALTGASGHAVHARWYAARPGTITGTRPCGHEGRPITFDVRLDAGWNSVLVEFVADSDERITTPEQMPVLPWHGVPIDRTPAS